MVPPFLGALLSDVAYADAYQIQWLNFASWLIVGGMVFCGLTLLCAAIDLLRRDRRTNDVVGYFVLVLATFVLGFLNALEHAKDAWATMPGGLIVSVVVAVLALASTWVGFSKFRAGAVA
ncbi:membrane protein [Sphingomonas prati]|nr:membrane protein [Sphingomonas prati]